MGIGAFDRDDLHWIAERNDSIPSRPVASKTAIVGGNIETGRVDFFTQWEPNAYCSFHRHLGETVSVVMEGELWVEDLDGSRKVRPLGHYAATPAGRVHWEQAGPAGATVFYSVQSPDGRAFEAVDLNGNAVALVTVADMLASRI